MNKNTIGALRSATAGVLLAMTAGTTSFAATVTVSTETGAAQNTEFGVRGDTGTRGFDLAGAIATVTFTDGTTETATWAASPSAPASDGGANGTGWSFFQQGDIEGAQGFVNLDVPTRVLESFELNLSTSESFKPPFPNDPAIQNGASVFDASIIDESDDPSGSTAGSAFGHPFEVLSFFPTGSATPDMLVGDIAVTYSGAVGLQGAAPVGDLFTTMFVDFSGLAGGGFTGMLNYKADTDTLAVAGDLSPISPVPLPAGLPLLLAGLGGLGMLRRKRG